MITTSLTACHSTLDSSRDDCVPLRTMLSANKPLHSQNIFFLNNDWCTKWLMPINRSKCIVLTFTRKRSTLTHTYIIGDTLINVTQSYKHLAVHRTSNFSPTKHIVSIFSEASRTLRYTKRNLKLSPHQRQLACETYVRPKLEYASALYIPN